VSQRSRSAVSALRSDRRLPHLPRVAPLVTDFTDTANHAANGATDGMIAIQMHYSDEKTRRWVPGGFWRWRVIAVSEF
jgi:hypothetical protein